MTRRPFVLLAALVALSAPRALAQAITGLVRVQDAQVPVAGARVTLLRDSLKSESIVISDSTGRFTFAPRQEGRYAVRVERIGFRSLTSRAFVASRDSTIAFVVELEPVVQRLAGVTAVGERPSGLDFMQGFEQRRLRGMGRFLTREEIAKRPSAHLAYLVRSMLGTEMMIDDEGYVIARARRGERSLNVGQDGFPCKAPIFVDGIERVGEPLERIARAPEVEGIEFYAGAASLPIQFRHGDSSCGVVLVWTRNSSGTP